MFETIITSSPEPRLSAPRRQGHAGSRAIGAARTAGGTRHQGVIPASATSGFATFTRRVGGDADSVLERVGMSAVQLSDPRTTIGLNKYCSLFEEASKQTQNGNYGLWFGQQFQPFNLGLIGNIAICSHTMGAALANLAELFAYYQQVTRTRLLSCGEHLRLEYQIMDGNIFNRRQDAELTLGMFANIFRYCLGADWAPDEVQFEHPKPEAWREHQEAFNAEVIFGCRTNALVFRNRNMDRAMPSADPVRLQDLRRELLQGAPSAGSLTLTSRVVAEMRNRLPDGLPLIDDIAEQLGVTRRTLQRRLADDGVVFSELLEQVRKRLAILYMSQKHLPLSDVGLLLGYSEMSAFSRACRDWFGAPPSMVRSALASSRCLAAGGWATVEDFAWERRL